MSMQDIAVAIERTELVLRRRPQVGIHADPPATAQWKGGLRVVSSHADGTSVATDLATELGGTGDHVSPGWLFRAGLASCLATSVAMAADAEEIDLTMLEVKATSRSDTRGLLGIAEANGETVFAGPHDVQLHVRIAASGATPDTLRRLVDDSLRCSPIPSAVRHAVPVALHVDVE